VKTILFPLFAVITIGLLARNAEAEKSVKIPTKAAGTYFEPHRSESLPKAKSDFYSRKDNLNPYTGKPYVDPSKPVAPKKENACGCPSSSPSRP
jgi:hypothetical protein